MVLTMGVRLLAGNFDLALAQGGPLSADQSDTAAVQVMSNVLLQSGGASAWSATRSAEESFTVTKQTFSATGPTETVNSVSFLLDDWSLDSTRYRRGKQGMRTPPRDHNGDPSFKFKFKTEQIVPEADQARVLAGHLPAAAAEVMLRRPEYVLKTAHNRPCAVGSACVDVFRKEASGVHLVPEQQWVISQTTGMPSSVRVRLRMVGPFPMQLWDEFQFNQYDTQSNLRVPTRMVYKPSNGPPETRVLISINFNQGFNTAQFDQEVAK